MIYPRHVELNGKIPRDFLQVMHYFNQGLRQDPKKPQYQYNPRKIPITKREICDLWLPSLSKNISAVAEDAEKGKVVGMATVLYVPKSTLYNPYHEIQPGELMISAHPDYDYLEVTGPLMRRMLDELRKSHKSARLHTDTSFGQERDLMKRTGRTGIFIQNYPRFKEAGLSGKVLEYTLP